MKTFIKIISLVISLVAGSFVTYCAGKYIILGVAAERGHSAVGGEAIIIAILFASVTYTVSSLLNKSIDATLS